MKVRPSGGTTTAPDASTTWSLMATRTGLWYSKRHVEHAAMNAGIAMVANALLAPNTTDRHSARWENASCGGHWRAAHWPAVAQQPSGPNCAACAHETGGCVGNGGTPPVVACTCTGGHTVGRPSFKLPHARSPVVHSSPRLGVGRPPLSSPPSPPLPLLHIIRAGGRAANTCRHHSSGSTRQGSGGRTFCPTPCPLTHNLEPTGRAYTCGAPAPCCAASGLDDSTLPLALRLPPQ
jgi:hypothetical protein